MTPTATLHPQEPATNGVAEKLEIPDFPVVNFTVRIVGRTPLIGNRFGESAVHKLENSQQKKAAHRLDAREPEQEFNESRYRLADGRDAFPAASLKKAIKAAAVRMTELKGTEVMAAFNIEATEAGLLSITSPAPHMRTDHVVRMGRGNVAYRPEYWPWAIDVPISLFTPALSVGEFLNLLRNAGFGIGIGNWRPEKGGNSGTFDIDPAVQVTA